MDTEQKEQKEQKEHKRVNKLITKIGVMIVVIDGEGYLINKKKKQIKEMEQSHELDKQSLEDDFNELSLQYEGYKFSVGNDSLLTLLSTEQAKVQRLQEELRTRSE